MANIIIGAGGKNPPPTKKTGGLTIGRSTSISKGTGSSEPQGSGLGEQLSKAQDRAAFKQKPLLVYLMVDLTSSRRDTRETMRPYEQDLAKLIMNAGGNHPVICKGILHTGGRCSAPQLLENADAVLKFLATPPQAGLTNIAPALEYYRDDETEDVLSLGILIGDAYDGDSKSNLITLAKELKSRKRPLVIAHQETHSDDFCTDVAPAMARAGEGLDFPLGTQPEELHAILANYKRILEATPDELKATAQGHAGGGVTLSGTAATQRFSKQQAVETLLLTQG